LATNLITLA